MIEIHLDGARLEKDKGTTLGDILPDWDQRCCVAILRPVELESAETGNIKFFSTAGEVVVEITPEAASILEGGGLEDFFLAEKRDILLRSGWSDRYTVTFGPFQSSIIPSKTAYRYRKGDLILGCGGYDPSRTFLIFAKIDHIADHGAPEGGGVIARVVSGRSVLSRWSADKQDALTGIERQMSWADQSNSFTTTVPDLVLEDGMRIISKVKVVAEGYHPPEVDISATESVEHMLLAFQGGCFEVGRSASTHVRDEKLSPTDILLQNKKPRLEGTVTVRTRGKSRGSIYIYTRDIPSSAAHTVVGTVEHGIELVKLAGDRDAFRIEVEPHRFDLLGYSLDEARAFALERGIHLDIDVEEGERLIVGQDPATTLEVLAEGAARLITCPVSEVIDIRLDDLHAPATCALFRDMTGLKEHKVGVMPFFFNFEDVYLFKPPIRKGTKINLENLPVEEVPAYTLAMTNDSQKGAGLVGVRTAANREFGPSSEPFGGTNIIGSVVDVEKLTALKEGEPVFIREVR